MANNTFSDIDPQNYYHNSDTHAIGVQGGNATYEYNHIDRVGGSVSLFHMAQSLAERHSAAMNIISNVYNHDQPTSTSYNEVPS